uniref:Exportin 5 n=1 Tax=Neogobius melanostomus TaxID=47308 RepID=A0A8C6WYC3_9GOBI
VMTEPVAEMCERLVKAVNVIMDPETNQTLRLEALKFCEEFKETSSLCIPCGLKLAAKTQPAVIRHFGLQILEHVIKYRWNNMQVNEKVQLKDCAMQLLSTGTSSVLQEESHIKDVLSRITVEMIKREWPQNWPDMLKEMEALTSQGEAQTELVMLILLRLAEDVITFQTLPTQRRRDIQQTLTQNMDSIFTFLMAILHINVEDFRKTVCVDARVYCRVSVATLNTLAGYIDWVSLAHITNNNCQLLEILCLLLNEPELQLEAAECLLIAISRKGRPDERKPFLLLFGDVAIDVILSAAQSVAPLTIYRRYIFLKRLCQVLCAMGSQLCFLAVSTDIEIPPNLCKYTEALMAFTTHTSHFLKMSTLQTWGALFRHDVLSKDPVILEMAKKYMKTCMTNLIKTGYPSRNDHPSCMYSSVDFDSDEDFHSFSVVFRAQQSDMLRLACRMAPLEAFQIAAEWLQFQITSPVDVGDSTTSSGGLCSMLSPSVTQWDAETIFMECMVGQIFKHLETEVITELLQALLKYETKDPLILSCVLTNTSALFPFVIHRPHLLSLVLDKLFRAVTFETSQNKMVPRTRAVKNVRRHACSSIIRICRDYPDFLVPCFDIFYEHTKKLLASDPTITYMEKCSLMEALVLISNQFKDFEKQKAFLDELLAPVVADWTSEDLRVLATPAMYLSFIGADQVLTEKTREAEAITCNRARLSFCLFVLSGVIKRAKWPSDMEEAKAGGFVVGCTSGGEPIYRNPCTSIFLAMLPNLFVLIRTQISLFLPENMARLSETFSAAHEIMDQEKNVVLGISQPLLDIYDSPVYKSNLERMQGFFATIYDICFHALGNACQSLLQEFYSIEGLTQEISTSVFGTFDHVPDHRLRPMIHILFIHSSLVQYCPPEYHESLLCPLLGPLFAYILQVGIVQRLTWAENNVRAYFWINIGVVILKDEMITDTVQAVATAHATELTELGKCLAKHESIYMSLLTLSFTAISWKDTTICNRSSSLLCWTLLRPATAGNLLPEAVTWFFTSVLKALQVHGQHEVCNNTLNQLAMLIYEALRPRYAELRTVMMQVPNINMDSLDQYDHKLLDPKAQKAGEKKRKDQFKRLLAGTIGKALCEQFKKEVHIKNLPTLFKRPKDEKDIMNETLGLAALFAPTTEAL